uniref:Predicted protein n=1 Tax=Hordeum vulgare subsp. vulgare TaxID=112509 RepID=F2DDG3_HORVV|nr:predicted protein [Hordeum vulgare subsp. vulgare]
MCHVPLSESKYTRFNSPWGVHPAPSLTNNQPNGIFSTSLYEKCTPSSQGVALLCFVCTAQLEKYTSLHCSMCMEQLKFAVN